MAKRSIEIDPKDLRPFVDQFDRPPPPNADRQWEVPSLKLCDGVTLTPGWVEGGWKINIEIEI